MKLPTGAKLGNIKTIEIAQFSENFEEKIIICHILKAAAMSTTYCVNSGFRAQ